MNKEAKAKLLKLPEVAAMVGLCAGSVRRLSRLALFPAPVRVGLRAIRWRPEEVEAWLAARPPV